MDGLIIFLKLLPESIKLGLIYSIMVMGVYISYKILDFSDLSVDSTFPLGGFIFCFGAISLHLNPFISMIIVAISGALAGALTAFFHIKFKINKLLSGILTMTALYSINARILGKPNAFLNNEESFFYNLSFEKHFYIFLTILLVLLFIKFLYDKRIKPDKNAIKSLVIYLLVLISLVTYVYISKDIVFLSIAFIVFIIKLIIDYTLTSKFGLILTALGDNETLVTNLGVSVDKIKLVGLMISNSLVAISGALFTQYIKIIDLSSSVGTIVIGLASIIFGMGILKRSRTINYISIVIIGSIVYYIVINFALNSSLFTDNLYYLIGLNDKWINILSIKPTDVKIITAIFLALILAKRRKNHA